LRRLAPAPTIGPSKLPGSYWRSAVLLDLLNTLFVIHNAYDTHRRLQQSGPGIYHGNHNVVAYPAVYELEAGRDYEIVPMSDSLRQVHNL
jgi:hypothetical protein